MPSPEGKGIARRAWDAYAKAVNKQLIPAARPLIRKLSAAKAADLLGFWLVWHLEGGFEGLERGGMSRATIYRRINLFRKVTGTHPDEFELAGVTLDIAAYQESKEGQSQD
jgi:hypothetical protein